MGTSAPLLHVQGLVKRYQRGWLHRETTFELQADFRVEGPGVIGVMGANGAGKTTLFELITGGNRPSAGRVCIEGQDIHEVRHRERDRVALHYHQSYQLRSFQRRRPDFLLQPARGERPRVHLFDEPQFNTQDGYIGFMLDFFRRLRDEGRLVLVCLHPNEPVHLEILAEVCSRFIFVHQDASRVSRLLFADSLETLTAHDPVATYLGRLAASRPAP